MTNRKNKSLITKNDILLVGYGLIGAGLASPHSHGTPLNVWILSSTLWPQPSNRRGIWIDIATWDDTDVWYD